MPFFRSFLALLMLLFGTPSASQFTAVEDAMRDMSAGTALDLTTDQTLNTISDVPPDATSPTTTGTLAGLFAWSGATWAEARKQLILAGGGHADYQGNCVYAWSSQTGLWSVQRQNSTPSWSGGASNPDAEETYPDGSMPARHTYQSIQYLPTEDVVWFGSGSVGSNPSTSTKTWWYDPDTGAYTDKSVACSRVGKLMAAVDANGDVWCMGQGGDPSHDQLTQYDTSGNVYDDEREYDSSLVSSTSCLVYDAGKNRIYLIGGSLTTVYWDLDDAGGTGSTAPTTSGADDLETVDYPGLAYHPTRGTIVGWSGGNTLYELNTTTHVWSSHTLTGDTVDSAHANGTFGRFWYMAYLDRFACVNSTTGSVFAMRLPA